MRRTRAAFSLAEAVIAMFLIFMVLGIACQLLGEYAAVVNDAAAKDTTLSGVQVGLQTMLDETRQSTLLEQPVDSGFTLSLQFQRVDPNQTGWLPNPYVSAPSWNPYASVYLLDVSYLLQNGQLVRQSGPVGGAPGQTTVVADGIAGFQAQLLPDQAVSIQMSIHDHLGISTFTSEVCRRVP